MSENVNKKQFAATEQAGTNTLPGTFPACSACTDIRVSCVHRDEYNALEAYISARG